MAFFRGFLVVQCHPVRRRAATVLQRFCNGPTGSGKILIVDLLYNDFRALQSGTCKLKRHNIGYSQENRCEC